MLTVLGNRTVVRSGLLSETDCSLCLSSPQSQMICGSERSSRGVQEHHCFVIVGKDVVLMNRQVIKVLGLAGRGLEVCQLHRAMRLRVDTWHPMFAVALNPNPETASVQRYFVGRSPCAARRLRFSQNDGNVHTCTGSHFRPGGSHDL